jgi:glycosyltransferase
MPAGEGAPVHVTVLTPTLDASRYIPGCLASVRAQLSRRFGLDHLVIDGGSRDETVPLSRAAGAEVLVAPDRSLYEALNRGIQAARGEIIAWLNADDTFALGALDRVVRVFEEAPATDVVVGHYVVATPGGRRIVHTRSDALARIRFGQRGGTWVAPLAVFFRSETLRGLGPYLTRYRSAADLDMWLRAAARQPPLAVSHIDTVAGTVRIHDQSLSAGADPRRSLTESMEIARRWYEDTRQTADLRRYALFVYRRYAYQLRMWEARKDPASSRALSALRCIRELSRLGPGVLADVWTSVTP